MNPRPLDPNPFSEFNCLPLGFYLDPEAWQSEAFRHRASVRHFRRLPLTSKFAVDIAAQMSRGTWGEEHPSGWTTLVAGKSLETSFGVQTARPLGANDLLKALVRLDRFGLGTRDRFESAWLSVTPDASRPHVSCIRFDIDMDSVFDREDLPKLVEVAEVCRGVGELFFLPSAVMTTGRRGVQAHYTLPVRLTTGDARIVRDALRAHLVAELPGDASLDKDSVDHLLRLPLTRHAKTNRLSLYLDALGQVLPVEKQVETALSAWTPTESEEMNGLLARIDELTPPRQVLSAQQRVTTVEIKQSAATNFPGRRDKTWSSLIREPLEAGRTWDYMVSRKGIYAHVARYGHSEAKRRLREKVLAMPDDGKLKERLAKVETLVDTFELWKVEPHVPTEVAIKDAELLQVKAYVEELRAEPVRQDCVSRQEMVYSAWLVAERLYGLQVTGARIARTAERLFGAEAPQGRAVYRALDMLREKNKIWFVTLKRDEVSKRISGGYLIPQDLG